MITVQDVERLLAAEGSGAALVVVGGRAEVVPEGADPGGLVVADRQEVLDRLGGGRPSPDDLARVAQALDTAVTEMGG
ncbi:hypothetical protein [Actinomadura hibisca]|uniref:hypothetical protein n=1 Tax=Actinomadura hibisca TaxID=68565 RepID=UPI000830A9C7|nr:hypothetical protein [Actinomadura hibisca]